MKTMNKFQGLLLGVLVLMSTGCKEEEPINVTPTVITGDVSEVYRKGATISGTVQNPYGATIKECGILISDFESMAEAKEYRSEAPDASTFIVSTTSLTPGKTYYYSAYASSGASMVQGSVKNFTTPESNAPILSEMNVSGIDEKSVSLSVEILDNGGSELELAGFCWKEGNSGDPTALDNVQNIKPQGNSLMGTIPGLEPNKNYRVRAYAVSANGVGYSQTISVTTSSAVVPFLGALTTADVTDFSVSVSTQIIDSGSSAPTKIGFCWSTETSQPTVSHFSVEVNDQLGNSTFSAVISELTPETSYYIRAFATNEQGTGYSEAVQITTTKSLTLSYVGTTEITSHSAFFRTEANYEGIAVPQRVGYCWSTNAGKLSLENAEFTADATWNGNAFECEADGLTHLTDYYVRPFFVSTLGRTYYGEPQSFATGDKGIYTKEDLIAFRDSHEFYYGGSQSYWINDKSEINIYADIDLGDELWVPIFEINENQIFNGNGHVISGLYIDGSVKKYGLCEFDRGNAFIRTNYGTVKNLTLSGRIVINDEYPDGASGICCMNNGEITTCTSEVDMEITLNIEDYMAWAFAGISNDLGKESVIKDCVNKGDILYKGKNNGGIVCGIAHGRYDDGYWTSSAIIDGCKNYGNICLDMDESHGLHDVSGIGDAPYILNCENYGNVTSSNYASGITSRVNSTNGKVDNCRNYGKIQGGTDTATDVQIYVGGIASTLHMGALTNCSNEGEVKCCNSEVHYVGGITGVVRRADASYSNNTNGGTVNGEPGTEANAIGRDIRE